MDIVHIFLGAVAQWEALFHLISAAHKHKLSSNEPTNELITRQIVPYLTQSTKEDVIVFCSLVV